VSGPHASGAAVVPSAVFLLDSEASLNAGWPEWQHLRLRGGCRMAELEEGLIAAHHPGAITHRMGGYWRRSCCSRPPGGPGGKARQSDASGPERWQVIVRTSYWAGPQVVEDQVTFPAALRRLLSVALSPPCAAIVSAISTL